MGQKRTALYKPWPLSGCSLHGWSTEHAGHLPCPQAAGPRLPTLSWDLSEAAQTNHSEMKERAGQCLAHTNALELRTSRCGRAVATLALQMRKRLREGE